MTKEEVADIPQAVYWACDAWNNLPRPAELAEMGVYISAHGFHYSVEDLVAKNCVVSPEMWGLPQDCNQLCIQMVNDISLELQRRGYRVGTL